MKRLSMVVGFVTKPVLASLISLTAMILLAVGAQAAITCDQCHGNNAGDYRPLDTPSGSIPAYRNITTGAFKGNHLLHMAPATSQTVCTPCHGNSGYTSSHRDGIIQFNSDINTSVTGQYKVSGVPITFKNQTSVPILGSCSGVNCHFESSATPNWGSAAFVSPTDCSQCHGAPPATGSHSTGGSKHGAYYGTDTTACVKCHPDHTVEAAPFAHATSVGKRNLGISFAAAPNNGSGAYSGPLNDYLPSQTNTFGYCSNTYCHSDGTKASPAFTVMSTAKWGTTLTCKSCHGFDVSAGAKAIGTNKHTAHINNASYVGKNIGCQECHSATTTTGNTITTIANHVDKNVNVRLDNSINKDTDSPTYNGNPTNVANGSVKAPGSAVGSCGNVYCHSIGNLDASGAVIAAGGASFRSIAWNAAVIGCDGCHGNQAGKAHPVYATGTVASTTANSHVRHVEGKGYGCDYCHTNTTTDAAIPPTTLTNGGLHLNRAESVDFNNYGGQTATYNGAVGTKSCSSTYCHSSGEATPAAPLKLAQWGDKLDCRSCHGGDAAHATPINTNKHRAHMNNYTTLGRGNNYQCAECHYKTITTFANNTTIGNQAKHVDTFRDYTGLKAGKIGTFSGQQTCGNNYCHSSGQATPTFRNMTGSKLWTGSGILGCNGCHGYGAGAFTPVAGEPNYTNVSTASRNTFNSHQKHTVNAGMLDSKGCATTCHRTTVDQGLVNKLKNYSSAHLNKLRDVNFAVLSNVTGHYNAGPKNCSNTYCHGAGTSPRWGGAALLCNGCHKADATLAGRHNDHWETSGTIANNYTATPGNVTGTTTNYRFECSSCHNGQHAKGPTTGNNAAEVFFNYTTPGRKGTYTYGGVTANDGTLQWSNGTCATTYCHSNGNGANGNNTTFTWNDTTALLRCDGCHGGDASKTNKVNTGLHLNHIDPATNVSLGVGNGRTCVECHAKTVSFANNTTIIDKTKHINKLKDYSGARARGSANYAIATKTCTSLYCHSNGKPGTAANQFRDPAAWNSATTYGCNGCHGQAASPDFATDPNTGAPNYASVGVGLGTSNSHKLHVQKLGITDSTACYACHSRTVDKYTAARFRPYSTYHVSGGTNIRFGKISTATFKLMSSVSKATYTAGAGNMTCSTVACHSNGKGGYQTAQWGAATNCALCHALNKLSRGHIFHVYTTATNNPTFYNNYTANRSNGAVAPGRYNYGCSNCHPINNPNHTKGTVLIDLKPGAVNVVGLLRSKNSASITQGGVPAGTLNSGTTVVGNTLTCNNIYCHSNGYATTPVYATTPDWYAGTFSGDRCANCHGNWPNDTIGGSPSHYNSNWVGGGAAGGHAMGIHAKKIAKGASFIGLLTPGGTDPSSHGTTASVTPTTISCNTCHNATVTTSANNSSAQCTGCHTIAASLANATIAFKDKHVNGSVAVVFQSTTVYSRAQMRDASFALNSSSTLWHRNNGYKANNSFDSSKQNLNVSTYAGSGGTCTTICHFNKTTGLRWDNTTPATCNTCHVNM